MKPSTQESTADRTFRQLCLEVDHWKARALAAERQLQLEQERAIKAAGLWSPYTKMLAVFGAKPADETKPSE